MAVTQIPSADLWHHVPAIEGSSRELQPTTVKQKASHCWEAKPLQLQFLKPLVSAGGGRGRGVEKLHNVQNFKLNCCGSTLYFILYFVTPSLACRCVLFPRDYYSELLPIHHSITYSGWVMGTVRMSSGGTSNHSGSCPLADSTRGSTSQRPPLPRHPSLWHTCKNIGLENDESVG